MRAAFLLALLLPFAQASWAARIPSSEMTELRPLVKPGEKATGFTLKDVDGRSGTYVPGEDGKPSLLVFWAVACPLCRELVPQVNGLYRKYGRDVRMIAVNLDGKRFSNAIRQFLRDMKTEFPVLLDDIRGDFFIASDPYGIEKTPTAVLVSGTGTVHSVWPTERMRELLNRFDGIVRTLKKGPRGKK